MSLANISTLLNARGTLFNKFRGGVIKSASSVYAEEDTVPNHTARLAWAQDVLLVGNVDQRAEEMYRLAMTNTVIVAAGDDAADSDVEWVIANFLDTVAAGV
jgi:hypothetical protein